MQLAPFPLDGLSGPAVAALLTAVPIGLVAWYPSRALLGIGTASLPAEAFLLSAAIAFAAFAMWIFTHGLRRYGRTGSSRYLDYGHRR